VTLSSSLLGPVVAAARETLSMMLGIEAVEVTPAVARAVAPVHEVSAVIGLSGNGASGAVVLSTDRGTAVAIVTRFAGEPLPEFGEDVADGLAELVNIVAGAAKSSMRSGLALSLPTVVAGAGHQVFRTRGVQNELAFLQTDLGPLCLQVHLREDGA
jgi:chemotaxis protein CheX